MTIMAGLVILITLPVSYGVVKGISFAYEAKDAKVNALNKDAQLQH